MPVVAVGIAEDQALILTFCDAELLAFDTGARSEGRTGGATAVRAVTVRDISELVGHRVLDRSAEAFSGKAAVARHLRFRHRFALCAGYRAVAYFMRSWLNSSRTNVNQQGAHAHEPRPFHRRSRGPALFRRALRRRCRQARRDLPPFRRPALGGKGRVEGSHRA